MPLPDGGRRLAVRVLLLVAGAAAGGGLATPVAAQDPRVSEAQRVAREWLEKSDAGDANATYAAASARFRGTMTPEQWAKALTSARGPYGAVKARTLAASQPATAAPNLPEGAYVILVYRTNFANRDAAETVTVEREPDGAWRIVGYSIR
jgi:Protein of unknown function (DUF4019)